MHKVPSLQQRVVIDNQLYFDKCIHAFYSTPSASGLFVYSDEGYALW